MKVLKPIENSKAVVFIGAHGVRLTGENCCTTRLLVSAGCRDEEHDLITFSSKSKTRIA